MYSPTTRLLTVLELLQSRPQMSGSEIARRLEIDVRTVRRYITTLQDMGIPVEAERGPNGAYHLERGRRLPPLLFTDAEAVALTLGLLAIRELQFPVDVAAVEGAFAKTERVLPENVLRQVRNLQEAIIFNRAPYGFSPPTVLQNNFIVALSTAVQERQRVLLTYRSWLNEESRREFDPYGIVYTEGYWYTAGYCHLRHDLRTFRLDRILMLEAAHDNFDRPEDIDVLELVLDSITTGQGLYTIELVLKTSIEQAQSVSSALVGTLETSEEGIIFRRQASRLDWIAYLLLSLDFPVIIKQPDMLRSMLQEIATKANHLASPDI